MIHTIVIATVVCAIIAVSLFVVAKRCLLVVDEGFVAIIDSSSNQRRVLRNGWHLLFPGFRLVRLKVRASSAFDSPIVETDRLDCRSRLYDLEPFVIGSNDNAQVYFEASLLYRVTDPLVLLTQKADLYELLRAVVRSNLIRAGATLSSQSLVQASYNGSLRQFLVEGLKEVTPNRIGVTVEK
jgi:regulator of protease activity HflC (stomatin/prohibitin superfamily)